MSAKSSFVPSESQDRLAFEMMLADLSSRFVMVEPADVDHEIDGALWRVCEQLGIDYAVLWQWSGAESSVITPTHFYPTESDLQPPDPLQQEQYPWVVQQIMTGRMVVLASLEELPAEAAVDRESAGLRGIKSNLTVPLQLGGAPPIGALAFNTLRTERDWPDAMVQRLQLVAQVFTNALARKRHDLSLQESEERLAAGAELAGLAFYQVNFGSGEMYNDVRLRDLCGIPPDREQGLHVLEFWLEHLHPDDSRRVLHLRDQLHDGRLNRLSLEYRYLHASRGEIWICL